MLDAEDGPTDEAEMDKALRCARPGPPGTTCQLCSPGASGELAWAKGGVGFSSIDFIPSRRSMIFGIPSSS